MSSKEKKDTENLAAPKTHHDMYDSAVAATTSRHRATKHVPCVRPYVPASMDPEVVEIDLVQLSQSVKTTNVEHTHPDRQTNEVIAPCAHPGMKMLFR